MVTGPANRTIARSPTLTEQVMAHLRERIAGGDFEDGRIPSEAKLALILGVSRTTVRDALSKLEHDGSIYRKQGAGTFVNEPGLQIRSRLEEIWSYEQVLRDHGYTPSVRVLAVREEPADLATAEDLGIALADPVVVVEKLFLEDDDPVALTTNRIPRNDLHDGFAEALDEPLYEFLEANSDRHLAYYLSEIVPVALDDRLAELVGVAAGTPAICFEEIGFDQASAPIVRARSIFRDDLIRFRLIRRRAGA
jgi:GntR family transcriptional regulator